MSAAYAMSTAIRPELPALRGAQSVLDVTPVANPAALANPPALVRFVSPVAGFSINSPFGMRRMPWEEGGRLHEGVDIAAPWGTPVAATLDGTVGRTGVSGSYGRFVEIRHAGGLSSFYAHLGRSARGLTEGMPVSAGQVVGYVGGTGRSTGSHLHFEVRQDDQPLNPALFIGRSFASLQALPIADAARIGGRVRIAVVSGWSSGRSNQIGRAAPQVPQTGIVDGRVRAMLMSSGPSAQETATLDRTNLAAAPSGLRVQAERIQGLRALARPQDPSAPAIDPDGPASAP